MVDDLLKISPGHTHFDSFKGPFDLDETQSAN